MWKKYIATAALLASLAILAPNKAEAFDITGGTVWENRTGPGLAVGLGFNGCGDGICKRDWGTGYSIGGIVGFHYRLIPNVVLFGDMHMGHVPVNLDQDWVNKDNGFIFQMTVGGEFHLPLTGWVDPYLGLGMGFAYIGSWAHGDNVDTHSRFTGFDFQMRIGADFYPFAKLSNLSIGPALYFSFPAWINTCEEEDGEETCIGPDHYEPENRRDDLPKLIYIGAMAKFWF